MLTETVGRSKLSPDVRGGRRSLRATGRVSAARAPILGLRSDNTLVENVRPGYSESAAH